MAHMSNPLATAAQLHQRTSAKNLPTDIQDIVFYKSQCLTQAAGMLLDLPQSATAQASVLLTRYWLVEPPRDDFSDASAAALYLVAKMGASPRSPRDLSNVYAYLLSPKCGFFQNTTKQPPQQDPISYFQHEDEYFAFQNRVLQLEARMLYTLSFDTHVSLPHPLAITYLQTLDFMGLPKAKIGRRTIEYLNTALLSPQMLYVTHQPNALATAAIYNAAKDLGAKAPDCAWWEVFDVDREELGFLVVGMRSVEGWARKQKEDFPELFGEGMVTRRAVVEELGRRGSHLANGNRPPVDDEEDMMMRMDERMADA